jgi:hypothetical protein
MSQLLRGRVLALAWAAAGLLLLASCGYFLLVPLHGCGPPAKEAFGHRVADTDQHGRYYCGPIGRESSALGLALGLLGALAMSKGVRHHGRSRKPAPGPPAGVTPTPST